MDPHSDPRTPGRPLSGSQVASWLYQDAALERERIRRLAILAATRPDLADLCHLLAEEGHRRGATCVVLASAWALPAPPPVPPGWWGRLKAAWKILFPGR